MTLELIASIIILIPSQSSASPLIEHSLYAGSEGLLLKTAQKLHEPGDVIPKLKGHFN